MKREEIIAKWAEMSARERDAWIAKVVFGCTGIGNFGALLIGVFTEDGGQFAADIPQYTTDISAAWAVFEHYPYIEVARLPGVKVIHAVRINGLDGSIRTITQEPTFPDAVCLAALIAELTEVSADVAV